MYKYSKNNAKTYSKLGIKGTTYEPGFNEAKMILGNLNEKIALDFGSGTGRSTRLLLSLGAKKVIGIDHNQSMIDQAKKIQNDRLEFIKINNKIPLDTDTFDVALAAYVFMEVSTLAEMEQISREIHRVLKSNGVFIIITNNPQAMGHEYLSFGYPKKNNPKSGEKIPCAIKKGEKSFIINDYYWSETDYKTVLEKIGFTVSMTFPKMNGAGWLDETKIAPNMVIKAIKNSKRMTC